MYLFVIKVILIVEALTMELNSAILSMGFITIERLYTE
jgi:hypothetical protein